MPLSTDELFKGETVDVVIEAILKPYLYEVRTMEGVVSLRRYQ